jgi:hypothetical protein
MANVTTCRDFVGRAGSPDMVVQQLGPLSEAAVLDLLYRCGQSSCSNQCLPAISQMIFDRISLPGFPVRVIVNRDLVLEPYKG